MKTFINFKERSILVCMQLKGFKLAGPSSNKDKVIGIANTIVLDLIGSYIG